MLCHTILLLTNGSYRAGPTSETFYYFVYSRKKKTTDKVETPDNLQELHCKINILINCAKIHS
jgi:hypothetical protein